MRIRYAGALIAMAGLSAGSGLGAEGFAFEVAAVKMAQSPMEMMRSGRGMAAGGPVFSGLRVEIGSMAMKNLIAAAYGTDIQHVAAPAWTVQTYFAIEAKMPEGSTKEQYPEMLRALLEERFHLTARRVLGDQSAYALTAAKNGVKLKASAEVDRSGCDMWRDDPQNSAGQPGAKTCTVVLQPDGDRTSLTIRTDTKWGPQRTEISRRASEVEFFAITMPQLADYLTGTLRAGPGLAQGPYMPVLHRTGIDGKWRLTVERVFADAAMSPVDGPVQPMPITASLIADELNAGLSKAGLRLEKTTAAVEMVVVGRLDQTPTEN